MKFTLRYVGFDLKCSSNSSRHVKEKQVLRAHFHKQLRRLWESSNVLSAIDRTALPRPTGPRGAFDLPRPLSTTQKEKFAAFLFRVQYHGAEFVPLITAHMEAQCHLALRIGRTAKPGSIVYSGGDLDGRLKTLFDSLAVPHDEHAVSADLVDEREYLCLLSDDSLITGLSIDSYQLLDEVPDRENYVDLNLTVTITALTPMAGTLGLLFG